MDADSAKIASANEHALPYRVLARELENRRPELFQKNKEQISKWLDEVDAAYEKVEGLAEVHPPNLPAYRAAQEACAVAEQPLKDLLHEADLSAICFSGGGIRSASFGLGVLTGLARISVGGKSGGATKGVLQEIDYVSTVSGGGYLGSWFTGWIRTHTQGFVGVIKDLAAFRFTSVDPEAGPVRHLRDYTSYLAPRSGVFSSDAWTLAAIISRNLLLNWTILIPVFAAVLLLPVLNEQLFNAARGIGGNIAWFEAYHWKLGLAAIFAGLAFYHVSIRLPRKTNTNTKTKKTSIWQVIVLLLASAWLLACSYPDGGGPVATLPLFLALLVAALVAQGFLLAGRLQTGRKLAQIFASIVSALCAAGILWLFAYNIGPAFKSRELYVSLAVPLIWVAFMLSVVLLNGLSVKFEEEEDREWWSRCGSYLLRGTLFWSVAHLLVLYAGNIIQATDHLLKGTPLPSGTSVAALAAAIGGLASWAGFNPATAGSQAKVDVKKLSGAAKFLSKRQLLVPALGVLFFVLLAIVLAFACQSLNQWIAANDFWTKFLAGTFYGRVLGPVAGPALLELIALVLVVLIFNCYINVNTFSLHAMYRNRLVRAYLGASNPIRRPNSFTNFDPNDDFPMQAAKSGAEAPLHIINMALNMVATKKSAWQQRKAESFTVSPLHSGSFRVGYRPTTEYAGENGITIGTAMAISGAAASPNMGYHSSPVLTLVMTLFNARLGWWLPSPGRMGNDIFRMDSPRFSLVSLLREAGGKTTDQSRWVYLSDGGHFENLGLYEMVLRRCKRIIVVDGSADSSFNLEDLGNAVRKINIDLGVPIEFDPRVEYGKTACFKSLPEKSTRQWLVGTIRYSRIDGSNPDKDGIEQKDGVLLYIKSSLTGDEPADVTQYAKTHEGFPHESTANQFFNESQFESYVRLGSHIVETMARDNPPLLGLDGLIKAAKGPEPKTDQNPEATNADVPGGKLKS